MKNFVVESYENYREEERLSTNNARRIEFITTVRALDELIVGKKKILDCAAGTGVYAFYLADKGHDVTATDFTPRHIEVIKEVVKDKSYEMDARVLDATDMSVFEDETFDGKDIGFYNGCTVDNKYEIGNICIIPEYQNIGIGTDILEDVLSENLGKEIIIQYFKQNPVGRLYERLGFKLVGETQFHYQMIKEI